MRSILALFRKELNVSFTTPIAYAMFAVTVIFSGYFFIALTQQFLEVSLLALQLPEQLDASVLNLTDLVVTPVLTNLGVVVALVAPFLSMRLISEEKRQHTFEFLMTAPIRSVEIVLGKYLGGLTLLAISLWLTLACPLILDLFSVSAANPNAGGIDWNTVLAAYLGLLLWSAMAMSLGLFISSLTDSQAVAAVTSILILCLFWLAGSLAAGTEGVLHEVLLYLSASQHFEGFSRGILKLEDIAYFLSFTALGLFLTHRSIESHRWT